MVCWDVVLLICAVGVFFNSAAIVGFGRKEVPLMRQVRVILV
jgi:hypothetical protein